MRRWQLFFIGFLLNLGIRAQCPHNFSLQFEGEFRNPIFISALTMVADQLGRPYLYVASNEKGLNVLNVSGSNPFSVASLDTVALSMRVMSVTQRDSLLYVVVGSTFGGFTPPTDPPGLVIVDVSDPQQPFVRDTWIRPGAGTGAAIVRLEGNIAYLGAAGEGLILLDISNPDTIQYISQFIPQIDWPHANNNPLKVNARGMEVKNGIVYLCYDAGGFRIVNCTNPQQPRETGSYANPVTFFPWNMARAYNNIVLKDTLAYIAVDYCGIEVLSIADTANIRLLQHWNPYNCPSGNWFTAPIHTNELHLIPECDLLFVSTGKSELMVLDVSNPTQIDTCEWWGSIVDTTGSWGVTLTENKIYLSYTYVPYGWPLAPFYSTWSGVKQFSYTHQCQTDSPVQQNHSLNLYPNPAHNQVRLNGLEPGKGTFEIWSLEGRMLQRLAMSNLQDAVIPLPSLPAGLYVVRVNQGNFRASTLLRVE
ncbi:MAG: T9SS type A sorting domain-containing protein [Bacteroidetes bacterium]|nr:T9SS type A sorting domain-containing protein [Bacteroidota bacterium]